MGSAKETETKPAPASTFETPNAEVDKTIDEGVDVSDATEESGTDGEESGYVVVRARPSSPTSRLVSFQDWRDGVDTWMAKSDAWREKTDDKLKALSDVLLETRELVRSLCCVAREETRASKSLDTGNPEEREDLLAPEVPALPQIKEDDDDEGDKEESGLRKSLKVLKKLIGRSNGLNDSDGDEEVGGSGKRKDDEEDGDEEDDEDEASDCSPAKLAAGKPASGSALKKIKDVKPGGGSQITPSSAQGMDGASSAQGPVKEEEIRSSCE